jgi:hypothetical protein
MSMTAREYLVDRFRNDGRVLRERVAALAGGATLPGPDRATSSQMASACDEVAEMLAAVATVGDAAAILESLLALVPLLEQRAHGQKAPAVRAVYAGAATRIREVHDVERRAMLATHDEGAIDDARAFDDADDADDEDADDDDLATDDEAE